MNKKIISLSLVVSMLGGCATMGAGYAPVVDLKGQDQGRYAANLLECQSLAKQVDASANVAGAAVAGAVFATALSAILGGGRRFNGRMAGFGGLVAGTQGGVSSLERQHRIISNCLIGRGFRVLG